MAQTQLTITEIWLLDILCALVVHLIYNKYEVPPSEILSTFVLLVATPLFPAYVLASRSELSPTWLAIPCSYAVFYVTLVLSILMYRASPFHPLSKFPGPRLARLSQLWAAVLTNGGKRHQELKKLHDIYGPYVRIGPNELSCIDANAIPHVLGPDGLPKGPIWDARTVPGNTISLIALRDREEHKRRRQYWNRALNTHAVKEYEETLITRILTLSDELEKRTVRPNPTDSEAEEQLPVDLTSWLNYFSFDFMGDMAFGGGFDLLHNGDDAGVLHSSESGLRDITLMSYVPWLTPLLWKVPILIARRVKFVKFATSLVVNRINKPPKKRDIMFHLTDEDNVSAVKPSIKQVQSDSMLTVIAGSDTTSTTLSTIFYYLLTNCEAMKRLRQEIDTVFPPGEGDPLDANKLSEMLYLNAVINEGLRLGPPLPTNIQRATPRNSGGKWLGARYMPPGTAINIPAYALHRCATYFSPSPNVFLPDRWLRDVPSPSIGDNGSESSNNTPFSDVVTNTSAFIPFSFGPANCVGKNLAMVEMRMVVALLVTRFDMQLSSSYNPADWDREQEDFFALKNGRLPVILRRLDEV